MKFRDYLNEAQKADDNKVIKVLQKGIKDGNDEIFSAVAISLRPYIELTKKEKIFLKNAKTLMDELWYKIGSSYEKSENYEDKFMKQFKKNFYSLESIYFKDFEKKDNYYIGI